MRSLFRCACVIVLASSFLGGIATAQQPVWQEKFSGQGISIGINPLNGNTIFVQGNDSRLNVSRDGGATFTPTSTFLPFETREFIIHPNDTNTVLVVNFSDGLYRSTDGGASFSLVLSPYGIDGESVVYDPVHPDTMYAGNFGDASVYRSTNRGLTWTLQGHAGTTGNLCTVAVRPDSSNILYAGTGFGTISKSTDAGATWKQVKSGGSAEIPKIVIDPRTPMVAYAAAYAGDPNATGIWKSTDGGEHWALTSLHNISMWSMEMDIAHPDTLYSGTFSEYGSAVYRTTDAGTTWSPYGRGFSPYNSLWNLKVDKQNGSHVYCAGTHGDFNPDGVYRLVDATGGVDGFVVNSLTSGIITSGIVNVSPTSESYDLSTMNGFYRSYRIAPDTTSSRIFNVYINGILFKLDTVALVNGSITSHNILVQPGSISGRVFNDLNRSGVYDGGDLVLPGWTVKISGPVNSSTLSDGSGNYSFTNLFPGTYTVSEQLQFGWTQTAPPETSYTVTINLANRIVTGDDFGNRTVHRVTAVSPAAYSDTSGGLPVITATFDTAADPTTFADTTSFIVRGMQTGIHHGGISFNPGHTVASFTPTEPFQPGEQVVVDVSTKVRNAAGDFYAPYSWQFTTKANPSGAAFATKIDYVVGTAPWGVATGDLNHDGFIDIVTANSNTNTVSVLLNNGDGTFAPKADFSTGFTPRQVVIADVDNDGDLDIITANSGFSTVTLLRNDGTGNFPSRSDYSVGGSPSSIALADFRGNGLLDILSAVSTNNIVTLLADTGTGYGGLGTFPAGTFPWWVAAADINGDGGTDVALVSSLTPSSLSILQNGGGGALTAPLSYGLNNFSRGIAVTDLNNDGRPDVVATNSSSNNFSFFLQDNTGAYPTRTDVPTGTNPWGIATGDLNGDGLMDVCLVDANSNLLSVYRNAGGGTFTRTDYATGTQPRGVAVADLNGDGTLDLVVCNSGTNSVSVFFNALAVPAIAGWNMISVPTHVADYRKSQLFPSATSNAFIYEGGYQTRDTLANGVGYWVKFDSSVTLAFAGRLLVGDTLPLSSGWNLIGSLGESVPVGSVTSSPPGIVASSYFSYSGAYQIASSLDPGQAYWVRSNGSGSLYLAASSSSSIAPGRVIAGGSDEREASGLTVTDGSGRSVRLAYSSEKSVSDRLSSASALPPVPPEGGFDVRFSGDRWFAGAADANAGTYPLIVHGAKLPLTIKADIRATDRGRWALAAGHKSYPVDQADGFVVRSVEELASLALVETSNAGGFVPSTYALHQNYPNPFNPSTLVSYDLPVKSDVKISIVNVLGQEVMQVMNGEEDAGSYTVSVVPDLTSGVYFYRLTAMSLDGKNSTYQETRKMMLMK